jgi:aminocarboxymuconate-semialdehyde decarboxylase
MPRFDPFWKAAAELGAPVVLHPFLLEAVERFGQHYLHNLVGYPFETTLAARQPDPRRHARSVSRTLRWCWSTAAASCPTTSAASTARTRPTRGARERCRDFRAAICAASCTTRSCSGRTRSAISSTLVGHDRVLLGSDHPFWMGDPDPLRVVREAGLDPATEAAIFGENAARIFRLGP